MSKKLRAICLIDIDVASFREAGDEEAKLEELLSNYKSSNSNVINTYLMFVNVEARMSLTCNR